MLLPGCRFSPHTLNELQWIEWMIWCQNMTAIWLSYCHFNFEVTWNGPREWHYDGIGPLAYARGEKKYTPGSRGVFVVTYFEGRLSDLPKDRHVCNLSSHAYKISYYSYNSIFIPKLSGYTGFTSSVSLSVHPSVDQMVSALYVPQY